METDLTDRTTDSLFEEVELYLHENAAAEAALDELRRRCQEADALFYLPLAVETRIRETFGGGKRTFDSMTKRARFCFKVWQGKYGNFNPEQAIYAEQLVLWAFQAADGVTDAGEKRAKVLERLSRIVNHETTDQGFKDRAKTIDVSVDVMEALS